MNKLFGISHRDPMAVRAHISLLFVSKGMGWCFFLPFARALSFFFRFFSSAAAKQEATVDEECDLHYNEPLTVRPPATL